MTGIILPCPSAARAAPARVCRPASIFPACAGNRPCGRAWGSLIASARAVAAGELIQDGRQERGISCTPTNERLSTPLAPPVDDADALASPAPGRRHEGISSSRIKTTSRRNCWIPVARGCRVCRGASISPRYAPIVEQVGDAPFLGERRRWWARRPRRASARSHFSRAMGRAAPRGGWLTTPPVGAQRGKVALCTSMRVSPRTIRSPNSHRRSARRRRRLSVPLALRRVQRTFAQAPMPAGFPPLRE